MKTFKLNIITPEKVAFTEEVVSATVPGSDGEITILAHHVLLFSLLKEGIVKVMRDAGREELMGIGGGYIEVAKNEVNILVSEAYGQHEINDLSVAEAQERARGLIREAKTEKEREEALSSLRRSVTGLKLLSKAKRR